MKRALLLACLAGAITASAQVPSYVPTDSLVAWYPLNGNALDASGNDQNGSVTGALSTTNRHGEPNKAMDFDGVDDFVVCENVNFPTTGELSLSVWLSLSENTGIAEYLCLGNSSSTQWGALAGLDWNGNSYLQMNYSRGCGGNVCCIDSAPPLQEWIHLVYTSTGISGVNEVFLNGTSVGQASISGSAACNSNNFYMAVDIFSAAEYLDCSLDDIGVWNRILSAEEITQLKLSAPIVAGCTNASACNYDTDANVDDGSCIPSGCMDESACNYNADAQCVGEACDYSCCPGPGCCGESMHWDTEAQTCVITPPSVAPDAECTLLNLQELAEGYQILLAQNAELDSLLSNCNSSSTSDPSGPCSGEDVVTYHGYDYDIVEIGDQCWFAENLRTSSLADGTAIPLATASSPIPGPAPSYYKVYGDDPANAALHGHLYSWHIVNDPSGLCPAGWSVPGLGQFESLMNNSGGTSLAGIQLKAGPPIWNGNNDSGFNAFPSGYHSHTDPASDYFIGQYGYLWTSTSSGTNTAYYILLREELDAAQILPANGNTADEGMSVRCVKD